MATTLCRGVALSRTRSHVQANVNAALLPCHRRYMPSLMKCKGKQRGQNLQPALFPWRRVTSLAGRALVRTLTPTDMDWTLSSRAKIRARRTRPVVHREFSRWKGNSRRFRARLSSETWNFRRGTHGYVFPSITLTHTQYHQRIIHPELIPSRRMSCESHDWSTRGALTRSAGTRQANSP